MKIEDISDISAFNWLIGAWSGSADGRITSEIWESIDEKTLAASGKTVEEGKIVFEEKLKIQITNSGIYYIADVAHNPEPVWFKLTALGSGDAVFENPEHCFPQKLHYVLKNDIMYVELEGLNKDGNRSKANIVYKKT